uniref:Uncharacterized protein n=1 Tax=Arundo donax TaxID=35708 RepID=A0A0A9G3M4_ARUDO
MTFGRLHAPDDEMCGWHATFACWYVSVDVVPVSPARSCRHMHLCCIATVVSVRTHGCTTQPPYLVHRTEMCSITAQCNSSKSTLYKLNQKMIDVFYLFDWW